MTTTPFHGGASAADRTAEDLADRRRGWFRRLDLIHDGRTFLRRRGIDLRWYPGRDLHDHPWPFVSIVLRGSYAEEAEQTRYSHIVAMLHEGGIGVAGIKRRWRRWSVHRMPLTVAHRITWCEPQTVTLVLRGRKSQSWGFYTPDGFVDQTKYDYAARRPVSEARR
jgi:hypothetical protein